MRRYVKAVNDLFDIAQNKPEPTDPAYDETYHQIGELCYRQNGFYIVGGTMALRIEQELGREALVESIVDGYHSFVDSYNVIADEEMMIHYKD